MDGYWIHLLFLVGLIPKAGLGYLKNITIKGVIRKAKIGSLCLFVTYIYFLFVIPAGVAKF